MKNVHLKIVMFDVLTFGMFNMKNELDNCRLWDSISASRKQKAMLKMNGFTM